MKLLALTTATPRFDACLFDSARDEVIAQIVYDDEMAHAERSIVAIAEMFDAASLTPDWIEAIACDIGPGSFTGVRVGLAGAKGIALSRGVPLVGVSSLDAMAAGAFDAGERRDRLTCVLDAKRGELFVAVYDRERMVEPAHVVAREALASQDPVTALPEARWIARLAAERLAAGDVPAADEVEPIYARAPDAKKPTAPPKLSRA